MDYKKINEHMRNKFNSNDKIVELDNLTDGKIDSITDNQIFKARLTVIAIDIVGSKKLNDELAVKNYNKLISEFVYGASSILQSQGGLWIKIQGDMVYSIFEAKNKDQIDEVFNTACYLNVFIKHLNKNLEKLLGINKEIKAGIGVWFSFENYITKVGKNGKRDVVFMGESVNKACTLANKASRGNQSNILFNELLSTNFTDKKKESNRKIGSFNTFSISELQGEKILGCNWIMVGYDNFVENNV